VREVLVCPPDAAISSSLFAFWRVPSETVPLFGGRGLTPARRALDSPMAIACLVDRAPCRPSRIRSISSRTNSPACVEGDFPSASVRRARSRVFLSGIILLLLQKFCPVPPHEFVNRQPDRHGRILKNIGRMIPAKPLFQGVRNELLLRYPASNGWCPPK